MIYIVGRSGSGKDYIGRILQEKYGLKPLLSYTDRPRRVGEKDTHTFCRSINTYNEMGGTELINWVNEDGLTKHDRPVAYTNINGFQYFATETQLKETDYYIIDPKGLYELEEKGLIGEDPIVYVERPYHLAFSFTLSRGKHELLAARDWVRRRAAENDQFSEFEDIIENLRFNAEDPSRYFWIYNSDRYDDLMDQIDEVMEYVQKRKGEENE